MLQVIAMVCHCVEVQQCTAPFLIVSPASVISNWAAELKRWAPGLTVVQYRGTAEAREAIYHKQVGHTLHTAQCMCCAVHTDRCDVGCTGMNPSAVWCCTGVYGCMGLL